MSPSSRRAAVGILLAILDMVHFLVGAESLIVARQSGRHGSNNE
jgi:hypothetical protein